MYKAVTDGLIDINIPQKKYWYFDYKQYNYMNDPGKGCYENKDAYNLQIEDVSNFGSYARVIYLPSVRCPDHLGFEIYEGDKLIGFTSQNLFTDETRYEEDYVPRYKILQ